VANGILLRQAARDDRSSFSSPSPPNSRSPYRSAAFLERKSILCLFLGSFHPLHAGLRPRSFLPAPPGIQMENHRVAFSSLLHLTSLDLAYCRCRLVSLLPPRNKSMKDPTSTSLFQAPFPLFAHVILLMGEMIGEANLPPLFPPPPALVPALPHSSAFFLTPDNLTEPVPAPPSLSALILVASLFLSSSFYHLPMHGRLHAAIGLFFCPYRFPPFLVPQNSPGNTPRGIDKR